MSPFSIKESLSFGWTTLKAHSGLVFKVVLTVLALQVAYAVVTRVWVGTVLGSLAAVVLYVVLLVCEIGLVLVSLKLAKGEHAVYANIVPSFKLIMKYLGASLLLLLILCVPAAIAFGVGFAALMFLPVLGPVIVIILVIAMVVLLFYFILRYSMISYAVLDGAAIIESLRASAKLTHGVKWHLLGFLLVTILLNLVGAILLLVGLLVTIPVTMLAYAHVYLKLKARQGHTS